MPVRLTMPAAAAVAAVPPHGADPADLGLIEWAYDPALAINNSTPSAGNVIFTKVRLRAAATVGNIALYVSTAGATLTSGQCGAAIYSADGLTRYAITGDIGSLLTSTGAKLCPLTGSVALAAGLYTIAWWGNGTTIATFPRAVGSSLGTFNKSGTSTRFGVAQTTATSAPATLSGMTPGSSTWWAGLAA